MAWLAVEALGRWRAGALPGVLYGVSGAVLTVSAALVIHAHGFEKPRWPTLANSVAVARALNHFSDPTVQTDVAVLQKNPQILRTLRLLLPPARDEAQRESGQLFIGHFELDGDGGKIQLSDGEHGQRPPAGQPLDVTPLPKNWVPDPGSW